MNIRAGVCAFFLALVVASRVPPTLDDLKSYAAADSRATKIDRALAGGNAFGVATDFVEWARRRIPAGSTYWFASPATRRDAAAYQWMTYRFLPAQEAARGDRAAVLVWYRDRRMGRRSRPVRSIRVFRAGYAIAYRGAR